MLAGPPAWALSSDRTQPINVASDRINLDQRTGVTTYEGHVVLTQGSLEIQAQQAVATYKDGALQQIVATGHPVRFRELPKRHAAEITGSALKLTYFATEHRLRLDQQVVVHQARNSLTGNSMAYDLVTQVLEASGSPGGRRVHTVIEPARSGTSP